MNTADGVTVTHPTSTQSSAGMQKAGAEASAVRTLRAAAASSTALRILAELCVEHRACAVDPAQLRYRGSCPLPRHCQAAGAVATLPLPSHATLAASLGRRMLRARRMRAGLLRPTRPADQQGTGGSRECRWRTGTRARLSFATWQAGRRRRWGPRALRRRNVHN